jgi:hypothetical protein
MLNQIAPREPAFHIHRCGVHACLTRSPDDAIVVVVPGSARRGPETFNGRGQNWKDVVIDGLKLTMTGLQLKAMLDERIKVHARIAADYARQLKASDEAREIALSEDTLEREIERAHAQIEVLTLIRDYTVADETYQLGEFDLRFADLLPEPDWMSCGCPPAGDMKSFGVGSTEPPLLRN